MDTTNTQYFLKLAPLPPNFTGSPQKLAEAIVARLKIVAPFGITTFVLGGSKPTSNQGPWLKDGQQWWVWDDDEADYIPLDISASERSWYVIQATTPTEFDPPVWFEVTGSKFCNVHVAVNSVWIPLLGLSGTTAQRPASPFNFQRFYDLDIETEVWWERGAWRTTSGVRGDVKHVTWATATEALTRNPGWEILGTGEINDPTWRGRVIGQATKDAAPGTDISTGAGVSSRARGEAFGTETHTLTVAELAAHTHKISLEDTVANGAFNWAEWESSVNATPSQPDAQTTTSTGGGAAHPNIQPTLALWTLRKT